MNNEKIVVVGGGGHAKVLIDILMKVKDYKVIGFTDRAKKRQHEDILGIPYIGDDSVLPSLHDQGVKYAVAGLGSVKDNYPRAKLYNKIEQIGFMMLNVIHPQAIIADSISLGKGNAIMAGAIVNPDVKIGNNVVINTGAIVEHDCILEDHVFISPGVSCAGNVEIGQYSHIGIGSTVKQSIKIGKNVTIGAGSLVLEDVPDNVTIAGTPAKIIGRKSGCQ